MGMPIEKTVNIAEGEGSYFDGNTWQLIGYRILSALVNTITLGIAYPWMLCMVQRWEVKHTVIHGRRLKFNGHGHQLIGKYLLWVFLTIITLGIYGIWLGLGMKKWIAKHTVYADEERPVDSYFSGGAGGYLGIHILSFILTLFTFGIGKAWADKMVLKWEAKHTHIGGSPLEFNGTGGQLFVKYLLLVLLTPLTLGIYALFFTVIYMKWEVKHTEAVYQTPEIQAKAKAHELTAVQDFAKYRIAANDQEIAAMKSGYTGKEDQSTLEQMAEDGNPFAAYHLAKQLKGENALYEDKALELLQKAANGKVHSALLDLAKQSPNEQKISMLTEAAQCGNAEASWLLVAGYKSANNLPQSAYWFKVAMEWGVTEATARTAEYDEIVKNVALQLSESRVMPQKSKVLPIVLGVIGGLIVAGIILGVLLVRVVPSNGSRTVRIYSDSMAPEFGAGDVIYLDDDISNIEVGDIIAYIYDETGAIVAHRVVEVITDDDGGIWYVTQGDNNTTPDTDPVHPANIIGVYEKKAGFFGRIFGSFSSGSSGGVEGNIPVQKVEMETTISSNGATDETDTPTDNNTVETSSPTESIEKPSTPTESDVDLASGIIGVWVSYNRYAHPATGEDTLEIFEYSFDETGAYTFTHMECMAVEQGRGSLYYDGTHWMVPLASSIEGTYKLINTPNDVCLSMSYDYSTDSENPSYSIDECYIYLDGDTLTMQGDGWNRTLTRD